MGSNWGNCLQKKMYWLWSNWGNRKNVLIGCDKQVIRLFTEVCWSWQVAYCLQKKCIDVFASNWSFYCLQKMYWSVVIKAIIWSFVIKLSWITKVSQRHWISSGHLQMFVWRDFILTVYLLVKLLHFVLLCLTQLYSSHFDENRHLLNIAKVNSSVME